MTWPFGNLTPLRYGAILADPPWAYEMRSAKGHAKSPEAHYQTMPIDEIAALANAGTLIAFTAVGACLLILRRRMPDIRRPFRTPAATLVGIGAVLGCAYLFISLPMKTIMACFAWNAVGLLVYFAYGQKRAVAR